MRRFLRDIWSVARCEWQSIWHDEGVVLIVVFALFIYSVAYSLGYGGEVLNEVPIAVVGYESGAVSRELVCKIDASPKVQVAYEVNSMIEAERLLRERRVWGIVAISSDFDNRIIAKEQGRVAILGDASYFLAYREVVEGVVAAIGQQNIEIVVERDGVYMPPIISVQRTLFNAELGYGVFVMPAIILLIVQQTALIGIGMVMATRRERGEKPLSQCAVATTIGRTLAYLGIYGLTLGYIFTVHYSLFHYPMRGTWWRCIAVIIPYILSVILLAQVIGAFFCRRESSIVWLLWFSIPFLLVSGVSLPPQAFPRWLDVVGKVIPSSSAVNAWIRVQSMGAELSEVASELTILWALVAIFGVSAIVVNRK